MPALKRLILPLSAILVCGAIIFFISKAPVKKSGMENRPAAEEIREEKKGYVDPVYNIGFSYPLSWGEIESIEGNKACPEEDTYRTPETLSIFDRELRFSDKDLAGTESFIRSGIRFYSMDPKVSNNCNDEILRKLAEGEITGEEFSSFRLASVDISGFYGVHNEQASRLDTEFRDQYTLFIRQAEGRVLVIQPYLSFVPYFDSPEWMEIEKSYKGDILSFIKQGRTSWEAREFLADFRRIAESVHPIIPSRYENFSSPELGIEFKYRTGPYGYFLTREEITKELKSEGVIGIVYLTEEIHRAFVEEGLKSIPGEYPPHISMYVIRNTGRQESLAWAESHTALSNFHMKNSEPIEDIIGGSKAIRYPMDGLYYSENVVVAHGENVYVFTGHDYLEKNSAPYKDFQPVLDSIRFIPAKGGM